MSKLMKVFEIALCLFYSVLPIFIWRNELHFGIPISILLALLLFWRFRCLVIGHVFTKYGIFYEYGADGTTRERDRNHFWYCQRHGCDAVNPDTKSVTDQIK